MCEAKCRLVLKAHFGPCHSLTCYSCRSFDGGDCGGGGSFGGFDGGDCGGGGSFGGFDGGGIDCHGGFDSHGGFDIHGGCDDHGGHFGGHFHGPVSS